MKGAGAESSKSQSRLTRTLHAELVDRSINPAFFDRAFDLSRRLPENSCFLQGENVMNTRIGLIFEDKRQSLTRTGPLRHCHYGVPNPKEGLVSGLTLLHSRVTMAEKRSPTTPITGISVEVAVRVKNLNRWTWITGVVGMAGGPRKVGE